MLKTMVGTKAGRQAGAVLLLIGAAVGAAGAQGVEALDALFRRQIIATSLFSVLPDEKVEVHASLEDRAAGPDSTEVMRLFDADGTVVARRSVSLAPGESATLRHGVPGRYRALIEAFDPGGVLIARRTIASTVEIGGANDLTAKPRFVCGPGDPLDIPIR